MITQWHLSLRLCNLWMKRAVNFPRYQNANPEEPIQESGLSGEGNAEFTEFPVSSIRSSTRSFLSSSGDLNKRSLRPDTHFVCLLAFVLLYGIV